MHHPVSYSHSVDCCTIVKITYMSILLKDHNLNRINDFSEKFSTFSDVQTMYNLVLGEIVDLFA